MDTTKVFDTLDRKIERLVSRLKSLETENETLKSDLARLPEGREGGRGLAGPDRETREGTGRRPRAAREADPRA